MIFGMRTRTQIIKSVIKAIAVYVVYFYWMLIILHYPNYSVHIK